MRSKHMHNRVKLYALLLMLAFPLLSLGKDPMQDLLTRGNELYAKSKYDDAVAAYQKVINADYQSAALYFNLGNAHYKLGDMPAAILYYEKAYKLRPGDDDIAVNLQLANAKITDKIEVIPEFFIMKWWRGFLLFFSVSAWSVFSIVCFTFGFLLLIGYLFATAMPIKKIAFYSGIALTAVGLISIFMAGIQHNYFNTHHQAIVFTGTVNVKSGPSAGQKTLFVIHEGTKVSIKENNNGWIEVELPNGNSGWIEVSAVKEI